MAIAKGLLLAFIAAFAAVLIWHFGGSPVRAQECQNTVASVSAMLDSKAIAHVTVDDPADVAGYAGLVSAATGVDLSGAVRVFIADFGPHYGVGFEDASGCLSDPFTVPKELVAKPAGLRRGYQV